METQFGFTKMNTQTFEDWLKNLSVGRTVLKIQMHHTYVPSYAHFTGNNHFEMQRAMEHHHVHTNGWRAIGQHLSIFPDGAILTGRSFEFSPACIYLNNQDCVCVENIGYFDHGYDVMLDTQKDAIVAVTAALCKKFNIAVTTESILYHHWFRLDNGHRNNGAGGNKSCPGTNFFGGNKVQDCEQHFLPLVKQALGTDAALPSKSAVEKYVIVTAQRLNIRTQPSGSSGLAPNREPLRLGSVLRVYGQQNNWLKISNSQPHWIYARYTADVERYVVNAHTLNVRSGPSLQFPKVGQVHKEEQLFVIQEENNWAKIAMDHRWVSMRYLTEFKL